MTCLVQLICFVAVFTFERAIKPHLAMFSKTKPLSPSNRRHSAIIPSFNIFAKKRRNSVKTSNPLETTEEPEQEPVNHPPPLVVPSKPNSLEEVEEVPSPRLTNHSRRTRRTASVPAIFPHKRRETEAHDILVESFVGNTWELPLCRALDFISKLENKAQLLDVTCCLSNDLSRAVQVTYFCSPVILASALDPYPFSSATQFGCLCLKEYGVSLFENQPILQIKHRQFDKNRSLEEVTASSMGWLMKAKFQKRLFGVERVLNIQPISKSKLGYGVFLFYWSSEPLVVDRTTLIDPSLVDADFADLEKMWTDFSG